MWAAGDSPVEAATWTPNVEPAAIPARGARRFPRRTLHVAAGTGAAAVVATLGVWWSAGGWSPPQPSNTPAAAVASTDDQGTANDQQPLDPRLQAFASSGDARLDSCKQTLNDAAQYAFLEAAAAASSYGWNYEPAQPLTERNALGYFLNVFADYLGTDPVQALGADDPAIDAARFEDFAQVYFTQRVVDDAAFRSQFRPVGAMQLALEACGAAAQKVYGAQPSTANTVPLPSEPVDLYGSPPSSEQAETCRREVGPWVKRYLNGDFGPVAPSGEAGTSSQSRLLDQVDRDVEVWLTAALDMVYQGGGSDSSDLQDAVSFVCSDLSP